VQQPLSGFVFVLDGVLIGAGDGRWLAVAAIAQLVLYVPVVVLMQRADVTTSGLWWGFGAFMLARGLLLGWRARGDRWAVAGATR
jgi:Na+-driven multidrug efflux pump